MSGLDCARFESVLAEALAAPGPCDPETAEALRAHAASCAACGASADLVDLATKDAASRDPFPDPPPSYWTRLEEDLAARIAAEKRKDARRRTAWGAAAAAAAVVLALSGALMFRGTPFRSETVRRLPPVDAPVGDADDRLDPFPAGGALGGFSEEDDPSLFPGGDDLTPEGEERLLEWLERERARATGGAA
jgi:hypothetical protein